MDHLRLFLFEHALILADGEEQAQLVLSDEGTAMMDLAAGDAQEEGGQQIEQPDQGAQQASGEADEAEQ